MQAETAVLAHLEDCCTRALEGEGAVCSRFLDEGLCTRAGERFARRKGVDVVFYGGYDAAQRRLCVFSPVFLSLSTPQALEEYWAEPGNVFPLALLRAEKDAFTSLTHRDYLGALMGLGLKRDCLGDILLNESGCDLLVLRTLAPFLCEQLRQAGRATLHTRELPLTQLRLPSVQLQERLVTVASLRLDAVLAEGFHLSRTAAAQAVAGGLVFVNGRQRTQNDNRLNPGDTLTLRGKGKLLLGEVAGQSKKGKVRLRLSFYGNE